MGIHRSSIDVIPFYTNADSRNNSGSAPSNFDNSSLPFLMAELTSVFNNPLIDENIIERALADNIARFLASHHLSQGSTPLNVRARLLQTDLVQSIDRN